MSYTIQTLVEAERGCGYRKGGGYYLVAGDAARPCGKLPVEVGSCPCCGNQIKPFRGISWVSAMLINNQPCQLVDHPTIKCEGTCFPFGVMSRFALMWVGVEHYKTSLVFAEEAMRMGISKRIPDYSKMPKGFSLGNDWVLLAHRQTAFPSADPGQEYDFKPGIFAAFCPRFIDYVVKGDESEEMLQQLHDQGLRLVEVIKAEIIAKQQAVPQLPGLTDK